MKNNANRLKLMKIINQASFAMDDVKLFLDTHLVPLQPTTLMLKTIGIGTIPLYHGKEVIANV